MNIHSPFEFDPVDLVPAAWTDLSRLPVAFEELEDLVRQGRVEKRSIPVLGMNGRARFHRHQYRVVR